MKRAVQIEPNDNVAVVLQQVSAGEEVAVDGMKNTIIAATDIPFPHKIAITDIAEEETIYKYGCPIGWASRMIKKGEHVHVHNIGFSDLQEEST